MPSKTREARLDQKARQETKLNQRLADLAEKGYDKAKIVKDAKVKMLKAELRKTTARLKTIADKEKKREEMAMKKAEKTAAPKKEKAKKQKDDAAAAEVSKRQQKKREKKEKKQTKDGADAAE